MECRFSDNRFASSCLRGSTPSPLVLVETVGQRQLVVVACEVSQSHGVRAGMTLGEAQALCGGPLQHAPHEPHRDLRALEALARWMNARFSPAVAPEPSDAIVLDVTGCERLFHGLDRLVVQLSDALARMGVAAHVAVAPTPGAAWALAFAGQDRLIVPADANLADVLAPLPVEALRIDPAAAHTLRHLGVETIGQLAALPRGALPARFGSDLLRRLDQALGRVDEPIVPVRVDPAVSEAMEFDGSVSSLEAIWLAAREVLDRLARELCRRGRGARRVEIELDRPYAPPVRKTVLLARPSRDAKAMFHLFRCALETADVAAAGGDDGFTAVRIHAPVTEALNESQIALLEHEEQAGLEEFDHLIERLHARLGDRAVLRPALVESYVPEKAYRCVEPLACDGVDRHASDSCPPVTLFPRLSRKQQPPASRLKRPALRGDRPLHLLFRPVEVGVIVSPSPEGDGPPLSFTLAGRVHRLTNVTGPERIAGRWWDGHLKTRDYFEAEAADATSRPRYWLFRVQETGKWYVHGVFD